MQSSSSRDSLQNSDKFAFYTCNFKLFFSVFPGIPLTLGLAKTLKIWGKVGGKSLEASSQKRGLQKGWERDVEEGEDNKYKSSRARAGLKVGLLTAILFSRDNPKTFFSWQRD